MEKIAIFTQQYPAGTNAPTGTPSAPNVRAFNTTVVNNIAGCTLDSSTGDITVQPGFYKVEASAGLFGYLASQLSLVSVSGSAFNADGIPAVGILGQGAEVCLPTSTVIGWLRADVATVVQASHYAGAAYGSAQSLGNDAGSGRPNVSAQIVITQF